MNHKFEDAIEEKGGGNHTLEDSTEEELVKKLKNKIACSTNFQDMLQFNNCLKELRDFWKTQERERVIERIEKIVEES